MAAGAVAGAGRRAGIRPGRGAVMKPLDLDAVVAQEPRMVRRRNGGWLAIAPDDSPARIATEGATEEEAQAAFRRMLGVWRTAYERYLAQQVKLERERDLAEGVG